MTRSLRSFTVVFDFDGTILPSTPWDSEQSLLLARLEGGGPRLPAHRRLYCRLVARGDRDGWLRGSFKSHYLRLLRGTGRDFVEEVCQRLAGRISEETRRALAELDGRGHRLVVASCGTADLGEGILRAAGVLKHFQMLLGNRLVYAGGRVSGLELALPTPQAKLEAVRHMGLVPQATVVVGDGPTDLPLLAWAGIPVVVAHDRKRWAPALRQPCSFITSIPQVLGVLQRHGG